jgi:hypothetical protein
LYFSLYVKVVIVIKSSPHANNGLKIVFEKAKHRAVGVRHLRATPARAEHYTE